VQGGYDFWTNEVLIPRDNNYTMNTYRAEASRVLANAVQNPSKPFFLYYAQQEIHAPVQVPPSPEALAKCANITSSVGRKTLCSMAVTMDDEVGRVVEDLKAKNLWNNTLLWVISDNGGMTEIGRVPNGGLLAANNVKSFSSNWPLRGSKTTLFEGGVRAVSFVCGGANALPANARGTSRTDLMHAVDIPTTIAAWAGATPPSDVDGFDLSKTITAGAQGQRTEVPVMIYPDCKENPCKFGSGNRKGAAFSAFIQGDWKLITPFAAIPQADGYWTNEDQGYMHLPPPANDTSKTAWRLYNLARDPLESNNVADQNPDMVAALQARIAFYSAVENGYVGPQSFEVDPASNPDNHNGTWAPFE
jgi:arylsulfatase A-like enzyme